MKRYSASSKKAQQWIKEVSEDNLILCSIYDELGHFKQSESIYESTIKIAKFIRVSEDNLDTPENEDEEDVDELYIDDVNTGRYDHGDISLNTDYGNVAHLDEVKESRQHINEFIRALSMGGSDVKKSLEHLSIAVGRWANPQYFLNAILFALSYYYKNPLIAADEMVYKAKQQLLTDDIVKGDVDQDTVAIIAEFYKEGTEKKQSHNNKIQQVNELLKTHRPDLADNIHVIKYILSDYADLEPQLTGYQVSKIIEDINLLDVNAVNKAISFKEIAKSKGRPGSHNFNYQLLESLVSFFSKYPNDVVYNKMVSLFDMPDFMFEYTLGYSGSGYLEQHLFGRQIAIRTPEMKLYPGLAEALIKTPLPSIFQGNIPVDLRTINSENINPTLLAKAPLSTYGMDHESLSNYYFNDKREALEFMAQNYPIVQNPLWLAAGHQMIEMDNVNGKIAFDKMNEIWPRHHNLVLNNFVPSLMPVYINFFSKYNKPFTINESLENFKLCYLYIGDKIYNYSLAEISALANSYNLDSGLADKRKLTIQQYEIIKQHSGKFIDSEEPGLFRFETSDDIIKFYFNNLYAYQMPIDTISNFTLFVSKTNGIANVEYCAKNLFVLGKFDADLFMDVRAISKERINDDNKDYLAKLVTDHVKSEVPFIGNYDSLLGLSHISKQHPDLSFTEIYACLRNIENAYRIRDAISKSKNYSHIVPHSEEYNKLFILFAENFNIRGRDPELLSGLVDSVIHQNNPNRTYQQFHYLSAAIGTFDFSNLSRKASDALTTVNFKSETNEMFIGDMFLRESGMKAEPIINLGGFDVLFEMTEQEIKDWLESIRFRDPDKFIGIWGSYQPYINKFNSLSLKLDRNILYNKILFNFYKTFFDGIRSLSPNIFDDLGPGSNFEQIVLGDVFKNFIFEYKNYIRTSLSGGSESDDELLRVYKQNVRLPKKVMLPKEDLRFMMTSFGDKESLSNIGKIVQIFGNLTNQILDAYSFEFCRKNGYPTKGFDLIPDLQLKGNIIHDFANLLPTNISQKFVGYPQYFLTNFPDDKKGDLKIVGNAWNSTIALWDDNDNVLEEGLVYEFSSKYNVADLAQLIKHNSFKQVMKDLPVESKPFAYQFCDVVGLPSEKDDNSERYKELFAGTQQVFIDGLKVKLPNWASFTGQSGELTLRFLRRDEPQGMFLGRLSKCCQEPENWAASCAYDGHLNPNAAFAVFEGPEGLIFQAYVWADNFGNVCFDSIESPVYDYRSKYRYDAEILMKQFANSLPLGKICNVGNNSFTFPSSNGSLKNPTQTNKTPYVSNLLKRFCPSANDTLYVADSRVQYRVGEGEKN